MALIIFFYKDCSFMRWLGKVLHQIILQWLICGSKMDLCSVRSAKSGRKCLILKNNSTHLDNLFSNMSVWYLKFRNSSMCTLRNLAVSALSISCPLIVRQIFSVLWEIMGKWSEISEITTSNIKWVLWMLVMMLSLTDLLSTELLWYSCKLWRRKRMRITN